MVKSIIVEYISRTSFYYMSRGKESKRPATIPPFLKDRQVKLYLKSLRGPITRVVIHQPRTLIIIYGNFTNSWNQPDRRIFGYMYNEYYDKPKDVRFIYDTSKNKIDLRLTVVEADYINGKHLTEELFQKYKV